MALGTLAPPSSSGRDRPTLTLVTFITALSPPVFSAMHEPMPQTHDPICPGGYGAVTAGRQ